MKLGILGGGHSARLMVPPAHRLGIEVWVLENSEQSAARSVGAIHVTGDWREPDTCREFAAKVDVVTLGHEFVPKEALESLEGRLLPSVSTMACTADKLEQKRHLERAGLLTVESHDFESDEGAVHDLQRELAVMVARDRQGNTLTYPVVETIRENHICVAVQFPARLPKEESSEILRKVDEIGRKAAEAVNAVGVLGVEMFLTKDGRVLLHEMAILPHNFGHFTLDCCLTSQFENHVRAVCGFPLGSVEPVVRSGATIDLLGDGFGSGYPRGLETVLRHPQARVHLYGKSAKPGRKLGHLTVVGERSPVELRVEAQRLADLLRFEEPSQA